MFRRFLLSIAVVGISLVLKTNCSGSEMVLISRSNSYYLKVFQLRVKDGCLYITSSINGGVSTVYVPDKIKCGRVR